MVDRIERLELRVTDNSGGRTTGFSLGCSDVLRGGVSFGDETLSSVMGYTYSNAVLRLVHGDGALLLMQNNV